MFKKYFKKEIAKNKGFTLVETLVAIFILVVAVTGPMSAAQNSLRAAFVARDQVVAYYLAQDAIEFIKNVRDYESWEGDDWKDIFTQCISTADQQCNFDTVNSVGSYLIDVCGTGDIDDIKCDPMEIDSDEMYVISGEGDEVSKYTRAVFMDDLSDSYVDEVEVVVVVEWDTNLFLANNRRVVLQENIYDWLPEITP